MLTADLQSEPARGYTCTTHTCQLWRSTVTKMDLLITPFFIHQHHQEKPVGPIQTNLFSASDPVALAVTHSADLVKWESSDERESSWHLPATPWRFSSWVPVGSVGVSVNHNSAASFVKGLVCSSFECSTKQLSLRWFELTRGPSSVY